MLLLVTKGISVDVEPFLPWRAIAWSAALTDSTEVLVAAV